jgi:uroporphyrinogen-III synthase
LCSLIERYGGNAVRFPVLEIVDAADPKRLQRAAENLDQYDLAIFISANAVSRALARILDFRPWPENLPIAVIGKRSAQELAQFGLHPDLSPRQRYDSEGLLELPELQAVRGSRIVIFRGNGGREFLAQTLRERGAAVDYVESYRRIRPQADLAPLLRSWESGGIDIAVVNSVESLRNLYEMIGEAGRYWLARTPLLVVSERMAGAADELGLTMPPVVAENATDEAVIAALLAWKG